jgi:hypothetical protein
MSSQYEVSDEAELLSFDDKLPLRNLSTKAVIEIRNLTDIPINVPLATRRGTKLTRIDADTILFGAKSKLISVRPTRSTSRASSSSLFAASRDSKEAEIERLRKLGIARQASPVVPVKSATAAAVRTKLTAKVDAVRAARASTATASTAVKVSLPTPTPTPTPTAVVEVVPAAQAPATPEPEVVAVAASAPEPAPEPAPAPEPEPAPAPEAVAVATAVEAVALSDRPARSSSFGAFLGRTLGAVLQMMPTATAVPTSESSSSESSTAVVAVAAPEAAAADATSASALMTRMIAAVASADDPLAAHSAREGEAPIADLSEAELNALKARALDSALAPFLIDAKTAMAAFETWKKSLWFVPEDFVARLELAQCRAVFLPFYVFSAAATSVHIGSVGFIEGTGREPRWLDAQEAVTCHHLKQIRTWAQVEGDASALPLRVLLEVEDGFDVTQARPDAPALGDARLLGAAVPWRDAFAQRVYRQIVQNERYSASDALRKEHHAQLVRDGVRSETTLTNVSYRLVYLPLYAFDYEYNGERYAFAVNGQTGVVHGERPYGVGSTKVSTLRALTGNFLGGTDRVRLVTGDELAAEDQVSGCYGGSTAFYLLVPSSDQFLLVFAVGWVVLGNAGTEPLQLCAQRRMRPPSDAQPTCVLAPTERKRFSFSGHWIIRVLAGNAADLRCLAFGTNGGDAAQDELKMCA